MPLLGRESVDDAIADMVIKKNNDIRGVYLAGLFNIISETPADTGRARNNWFLSVGVPSNSIKKTGSKGLGSIRTLSSMPKKVLNNKIYLTNNLPYIGLLEYGGYPSPVKKGSYIKRGKGYEILSINGYSKQAPKGWVRTNLIKMQNKIRSL